MAKKVAEKSLRFAGLIRVSTEQQEKKGESLSTQRSDIEDAAEGHGGSIEWYGGQEHATPGAETKEVDRLVRDSAKGRFDAVIVAHADRWSRDNSKSLEGLEVFKSHGIRFFVAETEYDLFNPEHEFYLSVSAVVGRFQASNQNRKSIKSRIARAKRGIPTCGKLPFGRTWTAEDGWDVDPEKQAMVKDVAKRYLAGEKMPDLAKEYGVNHANLHKVLMHRCGTEWEQVFDSTKLKIHEVVKITIPRLLDEGTIKKLREKAAANKTYTPSQKGNAYTLSGKVFCAKCGFTMSAQKHKGRLYYRHHSREGAGQCPITPKPYVRGDHLEDAVLRLILDFYGNPVAVRKAIEDATPNLDKLKECQERIGRIEKELAQIAAGRDQILNLILKGKLTEEQADKRLSEASEREDKLAKEMSNLQAHVENLPTPEGIKSIVRVWTDRLGNLRKAKLTSAKLTAKRNLADEIDHLTQKQKRELVEDVFSGVTLDGRPMGVYISVVPDQVHYRQKKWQFQLFGNAAINEFCGSSQSVANSAWCSPDRIRHTLTPFVLTGVSASDSSD